MYKSVVVLGFYFFMGYLFMLLSVCIGIFVLRSMRIGFLEANIATELGK